MLQTPAFIDEIQNALLSTDTADPDFLSDAAAEYAEACAVANNRLREIAPLLKQDLRSEVIQLAEIEPNLLDLVATLDFPEREDWCMLLKLWQREPPPQLHLDIAFQINETYAIEAPLQGLLKRHRLLPLAGAPLSERIATLRKLVQADPDTVIWQEDVELLEEARTKEIRIDLEDAYKREDLPRVVRLVNELVSPDWTKGPTQRIVSMAQELKQRLTDQKTLVELKQVTEELSKAHGEFDVTQGRELRGRYTELLNSIRLTPPNTVTTLAEEPLDWLIRQDATDEENLVEETVGKIANFLPEDPPQALGLCEQARDQLNRSLHLSEEIRRAFEARIEPLLQEAETLIEKHQQFDTACQRLASAISKNAAPDGLRPLYNAILSLEGYDLPADLMIRYRKSLASYEKNRRAAIRYRRIVISSIVGSIVAAIAFLVFQMRN